jgi:predicted PurR-regulated permease PerM
VDDIDQSLVDLGVEEGDIDGLFADLAHLFEPSKVFDAAIAFIGGIVSAFSNIALVGLILVFLLVDAFGIAEKLSSEIKSGNDYIKRVVTFGADIRQYVYITTVVGIVTGIGDVIFFLIFGCGLRCSLGNLSLSTELYSHHQLLAGGHPTDDIDLVGIWLVKSSSRLPGDSHHQWFHRKCC